MNTYKAPLKDMKFVLFDVLNAEQTYADLNFANADRELLDAVLEEAAKFAETVLAPINGSGDEEGCHHDKTRGEVRTPAGFAEAYRQFVDAGWPSLSCDPAFGGQGLPVLLNNRLYEMLNSANQAFIRHL